MCTGTIAVITAIRDDDGVPMALVTAHPDGGAATSSACLLTCPEARPGQVVLVHSGYVLRIIDREEQSCGPVLA